MPKSKNRPNKEQVAKPAISILEDHHAKENFVEQYVSLTKSVKNLDPQDALQIMKSKGAWEIFTSISPFESFPTKKVRFKVFPQSEEKLEYLKHYNLTMSH